MISLLLVGISSAIAIGIFLGVCKISDIPSLFFEGFFKDRGMQEVFVLVILIGSLSHLVEQTGGVSYLLDISTRRIRSTRTAELFIFLITMLINSFIAINTITILIAGPLAKKLAQKMHISPQRAASLLDIGACICQGIIPYAPQLLLAASLAKVSTISIMPYLHYQWILFGVLISSILFSKTTNIN